MARPSTIARVRVLAPLAMLIAAACARERPLPAEVLRLVAPAPGTLAAVYTVGDETRPVLALPPERRLDLTLPAGLGERFSFPLPAGMDDELVIASGVVQRNNRVHRLAPEVLTLARDAAGARTATLTLPSPAHGPGAPPVVTLTLTTPPRAREVEHVVPGIDVPREGTLYLAAALAEAGSLPDAAPITFEVAAREDRARPPRVLWSATLQPATADTQRWREGRVDLGALGGRRVDLVFRARATGAGRAVVVPVWADPTIVAPGPRPAQRRNVILISLDTLRADRLGVDGAYRPTTPNTDALAGEAVVFENTWAVWPETSGSHMSLFTSRFPSEHGVTSFIAAPAASIELLTERLRREGYLTRAFTEDGGVWALAGFARGFSAYAERRSPDFVYRGEAAATFADAAHWVEENADRQFFLFVHTYQVHAPYVPQPGYESLFADVPGREPGDGRTAALLYDREVRFTDEQVGGFIAALRRTGVAERSIVLVTSDHGEEFREHGGLGHGRTLFGEVLRVPLVVWAPGLLAPARVAVPTSLLDVAPTILDLLGLGADPGYRGRSVAAAMRAAASGEDDPAVASLAHRPIFGEVDRTERARFHLVSVRQDGRAAIADLVQGTTRCFGAGDSGETRPSEACPDLAELIAAHRQAAVPVGTVPPQTLDPRLVEKMRALGYLE